MNVLRKHHIPALAVLAGSALLAIAAASGDAAQPPAPTLTSPDSADKASDAHGFIQRWLLSKRLTLKKGPNIVRGAVINGGGATDFCARFLDAEDKPLKGFTVSVVEAAK